MLSRKERGGRRFLLWILGPLVALGGCSTKQTDETDLGAKEQNLGTTPATWPSLGPQPIKFPVPDRTLPGQFGGDSTGAVERVLLDPANPTGAYVASVNGGVWKTADYTSILAVPAARPSWVTTTDQLPSLSLGDLAIDPLDSQRIVTGTGCVTSGGLCGEDGLIYLSTNGGTSWTTTVDPLLHSSAAKRKIQGITVRGQTILVATGAAAGTGGIYRRTSDAGSFESRAGLGGLPATMGAVFDLVADPSEPGAYYALITSDFVGAGGGVYRTADSGTTWARVSDNDANPRGLNVALSQSQALGQWVDNARLAIAPTGELFVVVARRGRAAYVAHTNDQGASWATMDLPSLLWGASAAGPVPVVSVSRAAGSAQIVVDCGVAHGYVDANGNLVGADHVRLRNVPAFGPASEDLNRDWLLGRYIEPTTGAASTTKLTLLDLYTGAEGTGATAAATVTSGEWAGWAGSNMGGQAVYSHLALAVDPAFPGRVYLAGDASPIFVARGDSTLPAGQIPSAQWSGVVGLNTANDTAPHADVRDLLVDASGRLLAATDGGVYLRTNPTSNNGDWYSLAGDMITAEMLTVAIDPVSNGVLGGLQDNGTPASDGPMGSGPQEWTQIETADGRGVAAVDAQATDPVSGLALSYRYTTWQLEDDFRRHVFDSSSTVVPPAGSSLPYVNLDFVTPGGQLLRDVDDISWMETLVINHFAPDRLLVGAKQQGIWESMDRGDTAALIVGSPIAATSIAAGVASNVEAMWAVGSGGVFHRFAAGGMTRATAFPRPDPLAVAMAPSDAQVAYVTTAGGEVWVTTDGGASWDSVTGDLVFASDGLHWGARRLRDVAYVESASGGDRIVVAASEGANGAYMMAVANPGAWVRVGNNLPRAPTTALDYNPATDILVVATQGRGAWSVSGVTELNRPPRAECTPASPLPVAADGECRAMPDAAALDNGSIDPEGDVSLVLDVVRVDGGALVPVLAPGLGPGQHDLKLQVTDSQGSAALCDVQFVVEDQTPPTLTVPPAVSVTTCSSVETVLVGVASAVDNCAENLVPVGSVISKNGQPLNPPIPVINGQVGLGPGSYVVEWTVDDGSAATSPVTGHQTITVGAGIVASHAYYVRDRASVEDAQENPAAVLNSGSGITSIGGGAIVGPIVAGGNVSVGWDGYVHGDITAVGSVQVNEPGKHYGVIVPSTGVQLPSPPALPTFPPPANTDQWINPGNTLVLAPGSYGQVGVNGNPDPANSAVLVLSSGDYFFTNLYFNSAGLIVVAQPGTRLFVSGDVTYNTSIVAAVGSSELAPVVLGVSGGGALALYAPFVGTVIAPQRDLVVGTANGMIFRGSFFARSIDVTPVSTLVCDPAVGSPEPSTCSNGALDPGETDVDCGGPQCSGCADGDTCVQGSDCSSSVCISNLCQVPSCSDGVQNGFETGQDCGGSSCPACPLACNAFTYQAESMYHSTGNAWWQGGWNIYTNGYISATHNFSPGANTITVSAFGQQALGVLPHMRVTVGGVAVNPTAGVNVTTNGFNPYQFTFNAAGGPQEIRVIYDNDANGWFGDRNLIVRTVGVSCL